MTCYHERVFVVGVPLYQASKRKTSCPILATTLRFRIHSLDSRVAHGANDVRLLHSLHDRRNVLLLKLQVLLVLFYNAHFCGTTKTALHFTRTVRASLFPSEETSQHC